MKYALLCSLLIFTLSASVANAGHGIFRMNKTREPNRSSKAAPGSPENDLQYYGGPVIANAKTVAVYWGNRVSPAITSQIGGFYKAVLDSTYIDWLSEYDTNVKAVDGREGTHQKIGRGAHLGEKMIAPANASTRLMDADVRKEIEHQIEQGVLPKPDANTVYMVYFPSGVSITIEGMSSCQDFCAYHQGFHSEKYGSDVFYGVMPDLSGRCGFSCGGTGIDAVTYISSHELLEAITDGFPTPGDKPAFPQAWNRHDGQEIADLCPGSTTVSTRAGKKYKVSQEYDNSIHNCASGPYQSSQ